MARELRINARIAQWAVLQGARLLCLFAVLQGLNIIFSDIDRWGAHSFMYVMRVPGAPPTWGYFLLFAGLVASLGGIFGKFLAVTLGMYLCAGFCLFFALVFGKAALDDDQASTLGLLTYGCLGTIYAGLGAVFGASRKVNNAIDRGNTGGA